MYCDHCQTTVAESARFCPSCGGKLTDAPVAAVDPSQAPTVMLKVGPCESCGAPSLPGSTLCLPCTRAFESILGQAPVLPSAPGGSASPDAATLLIAAHAADQDEPLGEDEEYKEEEDGEDEADDLMAEESATILTTGPAAEPAPPAYAADSMDWSTPSTSSGEHKAIVALPAWARKGPDTEAQAEPVAAVASPEAPGAEPVPWWERNGQQSPTAGKSDVARYVPPPAAAPPASASLESTLARQSMRPKAPAAAPTPVPVVVSAAPRQSSNRSRTMVIGAALAGVAAIGTPVMWKLAFASKPTVVSALPLNEPIADPSPAAPRAERVHGAPASTPAAAEKPRVYQDLQPLAPEPVAPPPAPTPVATHAAEKRAAIKKPTVTAAPEPVVVPVAAAPAPPPLLVATPTPVVTAPTAAAAPPVSVQAEAVPLGQIFEVSQVETRPSVTSRFDPVLPARLSGATPVVVIVRVLVSPSGRAVEASPVKNPTNDPGVGQAAAATVRQWGFAPARKKGQSVSCWFNVGVVFKAASGN